MAIGENRLVPCPECGSRYVILRRARNLATFLGELAGRYNFACLDCGARFRRRPIHLSALFHAKCPDCLCSDLLRVSELNPALPLHVWLALRLGARLLYCKPCHKPFLSWRPPLSKPATATQTAEPAPREPQSKAPLSRRTRRAWWRRRVRVIVRLRYRRAEHRGSAAVGP